MRKTLLLLLAVAAILAHAQPVTSGAAIPEFEAVSIKPYEPTGTRSEACNARGDSITLGLTGCTVKQLIRLAYGLKVYQVPSNGPGWTETDSYVLQARAASPMKRPELYKMLQPVLATRFHLQIHWDDREGSVYLLRVPERGHKLSPATDRKQCGAVNVQANSLKADCLTIADFADVLESAVVKDRPVVNQTGLGESDQYAFRVEFSSGDDPAAEASIFSALPAQLGLTLTAGKAPVKRLSIDRVERPDPN